MLYERDYLFGLTEEEKQEYEEATGRKFGEKRVSGFGRVNNFLAYPKAARMCKSLFPNNLRKFTNITNETNVVLRIINEGFDKLDRFDRIMPS